MFEKFWANSPELNEKKMMWRRNFFFLGLQCVKLCVEEFFFFFRFYNVKLDRKKKG